MRPMVEYALDYADGNGLAVIPCVRGGKNPMPDDWVNKASSDHDQIVEWWRQWPDANIGFVPGERSEGVFVIDLDKHNANENGLKFLKEEWEPKHGIFPPTWMDSTPTGYHLFYWSDRLVENDLRKTYPGIEIRGHDLNVILPPSLYSNGVRRRWIDGYAPGQIELAKADEVVEMFINPPAAAGEKNDPLKIPADGIGQGERNWTLYRFACLLQSIGATDNTIWDALWRENQEACKPSLDEKELKKIYESALKREKGGSLEKWSKDIQEAKIETLQRLKAELKRL